MKTKTLTIKIPMYIMQQMGEKGQLNPKWVNNFLIIATNEYYNDDDFLPFSHQPFDKVVYTYTYRADCFVINNVKKATQRMYNIPITTYTEIIFAIYYDKLEKSVPYE